MDAMRSSGTAAGQAGGAVAAQSVGAAGTDADARTAGNTGTAVGPGVTGPDVVLIGGCSGVGKSSVGWEVAARLRAADVGHALIEGDFLDAVHPAPAGDPHRSHLTRRNLAALWANYADLGCRRLIYTNTASVLPSEEWLFTQALDGPRLIRVLLTATADTVERRLRGRELGSELDQHLRRSAFMSRHLDAQVPPDTHRVPTDGRTVGDIAAEVIRRAGWGA